MSKLTVPDQKLAQERLAKSVVPSGDCLIWNEGYAGNGYGKLRFKGVTVSAHRLAYLSTGAELLEQQHVRHTCDVKGCINVKHLLNGTALENEQDKKSRNRQAKGETVGTSKLTEAQVKVIKLRVQGTESYKRIGRDYGVTGRTIEFIAAGLTWSHLK